MTIEWWGLPGTKVRHCRRCKAHRIDLHIPATVLLLTFALT